MENRFKEREICGSIQTTQSTVVLRLGRIPRKLLKKWGDLVSLEFYWWQEGFIQDRNNLWIVRLSWDESEFRIWLVVDRKMKKKINEFKKCRNSQRLQTRSWNDDLQFHLSPQVSRTLLSILADLNSAVVRMVSILPLILSSFNLFFGMSGAVPRVPIIGITITSMFYSFFSSLARFKYLSIHFLLFSLCEIKTNLTTAH